MYMCMCAECVREWKAGLSRVPTAAGAAPVSARGGSRGPLRAGRPTLSPRVAGGERRARVRAV